MTPLTPLTLHPLLKGKVNPDLILVSIYLDGSEGSEGSHYVNPFRFAPSLLRKQPVRSRPNCSRSALRPVAAVVSAIWLTQKRTLHQTGGDG
jgi:hypothetical protein